MKINLNDSNIFKKVMLLFTVLISTVLYSQTYPVQVTPQLIPPYSLKISDYATTSSEKLYANILLTDVNEVGRRIRLKMYIEGQGISITTRDVIAGETPIYLDGGINLRLSNLDLQTYFQLNNLVGITPGQYNAPLPNGGYDFCFEVYDYFTNRKLSSKSCTTVYLLQNDPPILNLPFKDNIVNATNPQNVLFTWTPRHSNASNVQYEFILKELWDVQNPQANFLASVPFYQTNTYSTTLLVGPEAPQLLSGKIYGWQVRAFVSDGVNETSVFKNDGKSEIFWFKYLEDCKPPSFVISQALTAESVQVNWQSSEHLRYRIQYRKKGFGDDDWFEVNSYTNEGKIRNLEAATIYEFRVGGECTQLSGFAYSNIQEFTTPSNDEAAYYNCGLTPQINITNKEPLPKLGINETFTAGDFPVTTREVSGSNGTFSGWGYITLPFLENLKEIIDAANIASGGDINIGKYTRIKVVFDNVQVNSSYELIDGVVETDYDPEWGGIIDADEVIEDISDLVNDIFAEDEPVEDNSDTASDTTTGESSTTGNSGTDNNSTSDTNNSDTTDTTNTDTTNQGDNTNTGTSSGTDTTNNTESDANTTNNSSNNESENVAIEHNGKSYKNGDTIEVPYSREQTNFAFLLKNYPKEAKINWQVLKLGTDNTSDFATNETTHDNLGINMKDIHVLDIVSNYNEEKIKVTIKRIVKEFEFLELVAKEDENEKRAAKSGQILYLINEPSITKDSKIIDYGIKISPNLNEDIISKSDIKWYFNDNLETEHQGKKTTFKWLYEDTETTTTTVNGGVSNKIDKSVTVKWVNKDFQKWKFSLGNENFGSKTIKKAFEATKLIEKYGKKLESLSFIKTTPTSSPVGINWFYEIVPFESIAENKEDIESRLYYREKKTKGGFKVGLKGKVTVWKWGLPIDELPIPDWAIKKAKEYITAEVKIEASADAFGEVKVVSEERKYVESDKWIEYKKSIDPAIIGLNVAFGAKGEFSLLKNNDWFAISGYASGIAGAELLSIGYTNGNFGVFPLRKGVYLDLNAGAYLVFLGKKLETSPYYERIQLIDPIDLYKE
nr:hypothetical protein BACY1_30420 [Tenacibaculum mesophilum]